MRGNDGRGSGVWSAVLIVMVLLAGRVGGQVLQNGSFDSPAASNWTDSGWVASGDVLRMPGGSRSGDRGVLVNASNVTDVVVYQDCVLSTGTWTFAGWLKIGNGASPTNLSLRVEWNDAATNSIQSATEARFDHLAHDGVWRQIHVTGSCSSSQLSFARVVFECQTGSMTGDPAIVLFDDAEVYSGTYTGFPFLVNGGFERGGTADGEWWWGSGWSAVPDGFANSRRTWGAMSGSSGGVLEGWWDGSHTSTFAQCIYPATTGRWTFALWLRQEAAFGLSNAQLRLEWRDGSLTNHVQADTVSNLSVTADNTWRRYEVQGECGDPALVEIRAVAQFAYGRDDGGHAMCMDDARMVPGGFTNTVRTDGGYHGSAEVDARLEQVPGTNGFGAFLQVNYVQTTTTFHVLAPSPGVGSYPDSSGVVGLYTAWQIPGTTNWVTGYTNMVLASTVRLTASAPFHGLPLSGTLDLDVYRCAWKQPCDSNGVPFAEMVKVFYAPYFESYYGTTLEDRQYLVQVDGLVTNGFIEPQLFHTNQWHRDFFFYHLPPVSRGVFTNEGFESPPAPVSTNMPWAGSGWQGWGDATRDDWSAHSGGLGAYIPGWYTNWTEDGVLHQAFNSGAVMQPVSVTGGMFTFATWFRNDPGIDPALMNIRLEWYDVLGRMVQADVKDLRRFPRDGSWHHVFITGECLSNNVAFVVPMVYGRFWARTNLPDRAQIDNAAFYSGSYTGVYTLGNVSFEEGGAYIFRGSRWYNQPEYWAAWRSSWGARRGTWCAAFDGAATNAMDYSIVVAQNATPGPGTYTFAIWMLRDTNFVMTNAQVRLEWYDATFTNKVQADSVTNFIAPDDAFWHEYHITGLCTSSTLYEVRAVVSVGFARSPGTNGATCRVDDGRFFAGEYLPPLLIDCAYYSGGTNEPSAEVVPGGAWGRFLKVDYARTSTTFFVLADHPSIALDTNLTAMVGMRVVYWNPLITNWSEVQDEMTRVGAAELDAGSGFHGVPVVGTKTVDVYSYRWTQPLDEIGNPLTNSTTVYYCPFLRTFSESNLVENVWLLAKGEITNGYAFDPQIFGESFYGNDYSYTNRWTPDQDADQIPDLWELRYCDEISACDPALDVDLDGMVNLDEYIADTVPTNNASVFHRWISAFIGGDVAHVRVDAPTTNSRVYDVWWKTNLTGGEAWAPWGLMTPGEANGTNIWFRVTNVNERMFFRTGVRLP